VFNESYVVWVCVCILEGKDKLTDLVLILTNRNIKHKLSNVSVDMCIM